MSTRIIKTQTDVAQLCRDCFEPMTAIEQHYYECRCEQEWFERVEEWRHGGEDKELDELYGGEPRSLQ